MRRGVVLAGAMAGMTATGCVDVKPVDCWTRMRYLERAEGRGAEPFPEIHAGTFRGEVAVEDPENWWTGTHFTGAVCKIQIDHREDGTWIEATTLEGGVRLEARMGPPGAPFFSGETEAGAPIMLQHQDGIPVSLTLTSYTAEEGILEYGSCGGDDAPFIECHMAPGRGENTKRELD